MTAQVSTSPAQDVEAHQGEILADVRNHIGHLTLNRPGGLNAINLNMVRELQRHLDAWATDASINAVVLRGAGEKAFCAGGDIRSLYDSYQNNDTLHTVFFEEEYALDLTLHRYPKPLIALMDGFVLGGGMGLVQGADLRLVTERSKLAMPEVAIGYFPDVGGSYFLTRTPGQLGTYLGVTGVQVRASDALYCGLADGFIESGKLAELDQCLDTLAWKTPPLEDLQTLIGTFAVSSLPEPPLAKVRARIDEIFARPDMPGIVAGLHAVSDEHTRDWANDTLSLLQTRSPLAMAVTLEMLHRGRKLPLEQCFALELHLDRQWFDRGDLMEGVRALIIDKDKTPHWNPPSLDALDAAHVASFFTDFKATGA
ncbi:enoyl-CoA hydratase/isomerase family protein [Pseudomonas taetrolens]|uniref:enoyl-CoA hydratase/isomerase family protein n=1 Tax=Pseudomonas taetrolens TaxID=47884 RepID=UPI0030DD95F1